LKAVGPYIVAVLLGDDYGTQRAPMISVKMFRELFKPYLTRICKFIHETSPNVKVLQHSCGAVAPLIPEFIEAGVDALNPVQTTAEGMDPATLKREFGKDIVFWGGGVRCQTTLANGTADDVRREVKELVATWKPGGGYVFCPDHDIQENVPAERIVATYQAAQEFGRS
jgi:uroporphyrinogen decarboxylase